jgi:branched-chain amino acid transport system substrate-binding protein
METNTITRRRAIESICAAGALALSGCTSGQGGSGVEGGITVGILQDFSGPLPEYGEQGTSGFLAGLGYKADDTPLETLDEGDFEYSVNDIDIDLLVRDTQFDPGEAQEIATELVQQQDADILYGVANSGGAARVINNVVERASVPYIVGPAASADITASENTCNELVFRANENTAMDARSGGVYVARETDVERMALFGADYSFGRAVVNNYRQVLEDEGVEIVLERFVPRGYAEWDGLLQQAEDAGAQGMVGGFTAQTLIPFATTFLAGDYDMRLFGGFASRFTLTPVGSALEESLGELTEESIEQAEFGPFTTRYHWNQYDNEINDWFVENHVDAYDVVPDLFTGGAFTAASAIIQSFDQEGEVSGDAVANQMRGMTVTDTPKGEGEYVFQEYNNQARSPMTVAPVVPTQDQWTDSWPAAIQPGEPVETVSKDDVTIPQDAEDMTCDLT